MIATDQITKHLSGSGGDSLMADQTENREKEALALYEKILKITRRGDSVEIKGRSDGSLTVYKVQKKAEVLPA